MFKIDENVIFKNIDECQNYFTKFIVCECENDATMKYNVCDFFKNLKNDFKVKNAKNMLFIKCDDCFFIVEKNKNKYEISNYYINDDFKFLYDECNTFSSLYDVLHELYYSMCDENVSRETLNIFDMINK